MNVSLLDNRINDAISQLIQFFKELSSSLTIEQQLSTCQRCRTVDFKSSQILQLLEQESPQISNGQQCQPAAINEYCLIHRSNLEELIKFQNQHQQKEILAEKLQQAKPIEPKTDWEAKAKEIYRANQDTSYLLKRTMIQLNDTAKETQKLEKMTQNLQKDDPIKKQIDKVFRLVYPFLPK